MMEETETERDRDNTNMARLWIWPPHFIALVWRGYVWVDLCPLRSVENERGYRDGERYKRSEAAKRRGLYEKMRQAADSTEHADDELKATTCRKLTMLYNV